MSFAILGPSGNLVKLTKADDTDITVPRSLWVGTAGTANIVDEAGATRANFPLKEGLNPIRS